MDLPQSTGVSKSTWQSGIQMHPGCQVIPIKQPQLRREE